MSMHEGELMADVNALILEKIERFGPEVAELASEALKLSETLPEQSVSEQLEGIVRNIVRKRGAEA